MRRRGHRWRAALPPVVATPPRRLAHPATPPTQIAKSGCCGEKELIKLYSWTLLQYDRVVHLDLDTLLLKPLDRYLALPQGFVYTTDPMMKNRCSNKNHSDVSCHPSGRRPPFPVQGGFLLVRPNATIFADLVAIVERGDYDYGWEGTHHGHYWGGMTVQGLLPFYFAERAEPSASLEADRCVVNAMFDQAKCDAAPFADVVSAHFTQTCSKPYTCPVHPPESHCGRLHDAWLDAREAFLREQEIGSGAVTETCLNKKGVRGGGAHLYMPIKQLIEMERFILDGPGPSAQDYRQKRVRAS